MANSGVTFFSFFSFSFLCAKCGRIFIQSFKHNNGLENKKEKIPPPPPPPERTPHYLKTNIFILMGNWGNCILKTV